MKNKYIFFFLNNPGLVTRENIQRRREITQKTPALTTQPNLDIGGSGGILDFSTDFCKEDIVDS